ncbi:Glucose--fructose oxidoreductase precursor [Poriferisphaera corsica]|uniref:Glucose--fructose oxidoreductase n=1 Tax=Poriferisphaera corsica TaxID=2528020 RepID=A0A517YS85_9BACT|nr:Gfo/Idh/MocA family oxidoreductase [Poriferisphaera corsica]QDU33078.1 Glucose--fructose oxidoreductase precursor [Poriferisphaera corsica]
MYRVGVIGLGMMGLTHIEAWSKNPQATITAIADQDAKRLSGEDVAAANLDGLAETNFDYNTVKKYTDAFELIADPDIDIVDICLPTHLHLMFTKAAVEAGKHVLVEKPLARNFTDAQAIVEIAKSTNKIVMPAQCMRFWPGWDWLKQVIDNKTYGNVLSANFKRMGSHPKGAFYENGDLNGGGLLDIHIHDTDFIQFLFGMPSAVSSTGYSFHTNKTDHVVTQYFYDQVPLVTAEGGWWTVDDTPFVMTYTVTFEKAVAIFDIAQGSHVTLKQPNQDAVQLSMTGEMGYQSEINYFVDCVKNNQQPTIVTPQEAANTIKISEAEQGSVEQGKKVYLS